MDVKGEVLLQLFNKSKSRNGAKTFLEPKFFLFIVKFKKLGFSAPLMGLPLPLSGLVVTGGSLTRRPKRSLRCLLFGVP